MASAPRWYALTSDRSSYPDQTELWIAANRAMLYGTVGRWLLHDLRNPVQALALVAELFSDEPTTVFDPTLVGTLVETASHLGHTLELQDRVLRLPQPPRGQPWPVALGPLLEFLRDLHAARRSAVTFEIDHGGPTVPAVAADEPALEHAVLNLIVNAYEEIGERGDGRIALTVVPSGEWVDLLVEDNGPGLAAEMAERAFEPFVTTKTGRPFAGLGLPVARLLVERLGGRLDHEEVPTGTRFRLRLRAWPRE